MTYIPLKRDYPQDLLTKEKSHTWEASIQRGPQLEKHNAYTPLQLEELTKPHCYRPGLVALGEIRRFQKSTGCLNEKSPFQKCVQEISQEYQIFPQRPGTPSMQVTFQSTAIATLQKAAENFIGGLFEDVNLFEVHAKKPQ